MHGCSPNNPKAEADVYGHAVLHSRILSEIGGWRDERRREGDFEGGRKGER